QQIARIQDRIETLGYGIEAGDTTEEEETEAAALAPVLKAWKAYKFALGKVTAQPTWHQAPVWPVAPAIPEIAAAPMLVEEPLA
ncbi:tail fiber assembly domain-containing protein, partial [Pseudomonas syringae pv. actinidiae ICMP 19070]